jgi:SOS-response transcriptional repressor LexA
MSFNVQMGEIKEIRLGNLRKLGFTAAQLADRAGGKTSYWSDMLRGEKSFGEKKARNTEYDLGLPVGFLDQVRSSAGQPETSPGPEIRGTVPLLSSVQAGAYKELVDNHHAGDGGMEQIPTSVPIKAHTFALRVAGDSMEPEFHDGMVLIVEPELDPTPGDYVIAKNGSEETTFKQLIKDGADWYLKPLNARYPIKPLGDSQIIGVVRAVERRFR